MSPHSFTEMNRKWSAHHFVINLVRNWGEFKVLFVDTKHSRYMNRKLSELSAYARRKFETLIVLEFPQERLKFIYE